MVKNKKGFTLIELLAVIIILAIILSITTVFVVKIINDAKKEAFRNSAYGLIKSAENKHLSNLLKGKEKEFISEYKNFSFFNGEKLDFKGTIPKEGTIAILNGKVGLAITNGSWCAKKEYDDSKITIIKYTKSKCVFKMNDELIVFVANPISMSANEVEEIFIINEDDEIIGLTEEGTSLPRVIIPDIIDGESVTVDEEQILEEAQSIEISLIRGSESVVQEIMEAYNKTPFVNISLVLDVSGSMNYRLDGKSSNQFNPSRLDILKEIAANLVNNLQYNPNIYINIVPFSYTANYSEDNTEPDSVHPIYSATMDYDEIITRIDDLRAEGGTNTGDGLRRGYYNIKNFRERLNISEDRSVKNIMFLMTDGVPNLEVLNGTWKKVAIFTNFTVDEQQKYYLEDGNIESYKIGVIYENRPNVSYALGDVAEGSMGYIEAVGDLIKNYKIGTNEPIDSYVVGFSALPGDLLSIDETTEAINAKETFIAQTSEALEGSFNKLLIDAMNKSIQIIR